MVRRDRRDITTVQIKVKTRAELDKLGDIHKETYDEIIQRIIIVYKDMYSIFGDYSRKEWKELVEKMKKNARMF